MNKEADKIVLQSILNMQIWPSAIIKHVHIIYHAQL